MFILVIELKHYNQIYNFEHILMQQIFLTSLADVNCMINIIWKYVRPQISVLRRSAVPYGHNSIIMSTVKWRIWANLIWRNSGSLNI